MYHYTYEVSTSNPTDSRQKYIGVRSSECYPTEDSYYGSCKSFTEWQKVNGKESLAKKIFAIHQTRELAMEHEIKLHELFDVGTNEMYFNQVRATSTGFSNAGNKDIHNKIGDALRGRKSPLRDRPRTEEVKAKIRQKHIGKVMSPESRAKMSKARLGKEPANKGIPKTEDEKLLMSQRIHKTYSENPEIKDKISQSVKALWEDDEYRQRMSDAHKGQVPWNKGLKTSKQRIKENKL